jgi:hypothetical protein
MREPSLSCGVSAATESYRFTWLRTFHHPVVVRASWSGDSGELSSVETDGAGGYEPGNILRTAKQAISKAQWDALTTAIHSADFWALPTEEQTNAVVLDGAQWILEGRRGDEYHAVHRSSPKSGPYRDASLQLLQAAGISTPSGEVY